MVKLVLYNLRLLHLLKFCHIWFNWSGVEKRWLWSCWGSIQGAETHTRRGMFDSLSVRLKYNLYWICSYYVLFRHVHCSWLYLKQSKKQKRRQVQKQVIKWKIFERPSRKIHGGSLLLFSLFSRFFSSIMWSFHMYCNSYCFIFFCIILFWTNSM